MPAGPAIARVPGPRAARRAARSRPRASALRRTLRVSTAEGIAAEVVGACTGGAAITGWALHLGCATPVLGLLGALPFLAHLLQIPAARLTARYGARRVAVVAVAISRQAFLPLALLPLLPVERATARVLLLVGAVTLHGCGIVCNNGWVAWMGELVPGSLRGRYFGRRTALCTAAGAAATLAAGVALDAGPRQALSAAALSSLAAVASLSGAVSTVLMARQHGGGRRPRLGARPSLLRVLRASPQRRLAVYLALSGAASGLAVPYAALFMLRDRGLGFAFVAVHGALAALARTLSAAALGRKVDRPGGARRLIACASALQAASPLLLLAAARAGPAALLLEAVVGGVAGSAAGVAGTALQLAVAPPDERPAHAAVFAVTGGLAFGLGAVAASPLAALAPGLAACGPLTVAFACSAALRGGSFASAVLLRADGERAGPPHVGSVGTRVRGGGEGRE
ncbi:MAG TPA: MFS transporter [Anaeromyxobacter sp.]